MTNHTETAPKFTQIADIIHSSLYYAGFESFNSALDVMWRLSLLVLYPAPKGFPPSSSFNVISTKNLLITRLQFSIWLHNSETCFFLHYFFMSSKIVMNIIHFLCCSPTDLRRSSGMTRPLLSWMMSKLSLPMRRTIALAVKSHWNTSSRL